MNDPVVVIQVRPADLMPGDIVRGLIERRGLWIEIEPRPAWVSEVTQ